MSKFFRGKQDSKFYKGETNTSEAHLEQSLPISQTPNPIPNEYEYSKKASSPTKLRSPRSLTEKISYDRYVNISRNIKQTLHSRTPGDDYEKKGSENLEEGHQNVSGSFISFKSESLPTFFSSRFQKKGVTLHPEKTEIGSESLQRLKQDLILSIKHGNLQELNDILPKCPIDLINDSNILHLSCSLGFEKIVDRILEIKGLELNRTESKLGFTALHFSVKHLSLFRKLLFQRDIICTICNNEGNEVIHLLVSRKLSLPSKKTTLRAKKKN